MSNQAVEEEESVLGNLFGGVMDARTLFGTAEKPEGHDGTHNQLRSDSQMFERAGAGASLIGRLGDIPAMKPIAGELGAISHTAKAADHFRNIAHPENSEPHMPGRRDDRRKIDKRGDETVRGVAEAAFAVGDGAEMFGPAGKTVGMAGKVLGHSMLVTNDGDDYIRQKGAAGKDVDGRVLSMSDRLAEDGAQARYHTHQALGNNTASDVLSEVAGVGTMLNELPGAGLQSVLMGIAARADKAGVGTAAAKTKEFVTDKKTQEWAARIYQGMY